MATRHETAEARYNEARQAYLEADARAHSAWQTAHEDGTVEAVEEAYRLQDEANEALSKAIAAHKHMQDMSTDAEETTTETTAESKEETEMEERRQEVAMAIATAMVAQTRRNGLKMNLQFFAANASTSPRANRVVVRATDDGGFEAEFFKTHKHIAVVASKDTDWHRNKEHNPTQAREDFRTWIQSNASKFGVNWMPELQQQAWDRKYWKYETDEQVEEDAIELMGWTIKTICEKVGLKVELGKMALDSIVPMDSPLGYVENGKYTKNGNWAVAQVNLEVRATIEDKEIDIIYPIEMRSGQLTKIKLTKEEIKAMVADSGVA